MKMQTTLSITAALLLASGSIIASQGGRASVHALAHVTPCIAHKATVTAYLHASRHGSWITDGPGTNTQGMAVSFRVASAKERDELLSYVYRPQMYLYNSFYAVFVGEVTCDGERPTFEIHGLDGVRVQPVRDAG